MLCYRFFSAVFNFCKIKSYCKWKCNFYRSGVQNTSSGWLHIGHESEKRQWLHNLLTWRHRPLLHLRSGRDSTKKAANYIERMVSVKKVVSRTQIFLCNFFSNWIFIPSWFLIKLWWYYSEQQKKHIQERASQCIWNKDLIFAQKYFNSTTLSMRVVYTYMCVWKFNCVYRCDFLPPLI